MSDPLVDLLVAEFKEIYFEPRSDGMLWCDDSNTGLDPVELAEKIRKVLRDGPRHPSEHLSEEAQR